MMFKTGKVRGDATFNFSNLQGRYQGALSGRLLEHLFRCFSLSWIWGGGLPRIAAVVLIYIHLVLLGDNSLVAQSALGRIEGQVFSIGPNGDQYFIPAATLTLASESGGGIPREVVSDFSGQFVFEEVPLGRYRLTATSSGMKSSEQLIEVIAGSVLRRDIELSLDVVKESIEVKGNVTTPLEEGASPSTELQRSQIKYLPNKPTKVAEVLPLVPGVVRTPDGEIRISGGSEHNSARFLLTQPT